MARLVKDTHPLSFLIGSKPRISGTPPSFASRRFFPADWKNTFQLG